MFPRVQVMVLSRCAVNRPSIVDEDVRGTHRNHDVSEELVGPVVGTQIGGEASPLAPEAANLSRGFFRRAAVAVAADGRARIGECQGDGRAQAARGSGYQGGFALESE